MSSPLRRYALVGTGGRARMYIHAILGDFAQWNELVALCDLSQTRMDWYNRQIQERAGETLPTYDASDFDRMIAETKPDVVIVTTMDATHHQYICRAMELGCDAITEKPMTTDDANARQIFETIENTGRSLRVTFNYRYAAFGDRRARTDHAGRGGPPPPRRLLLGAGYPARRRLLPPLAPRKGQVRRPVGA